MGRGSPVCQQIREKIIEMFKNNVPQRKIGRDLDISPSTVHNIIKRFKESGGISVRKGQGQYLITSPKLLLSQLSLECVAGLNDRKGCIFTNDMKLNIEVEVSQNMKYFVFILSAMKYKSK